jgi:hypothetical protein
MKRLSIIAVVLVLFSGILFAGAFLDYFHANSDGDNIRLEWKTRAENGVEKFEIERKAGHDGEFVSLSSVEPRGSNSTYDYIDRSAYKEAASVYVYRLKIVDSGAPPSYSSEVTVSHSVSSVKRTWGSIKAMFR